jgi:hypothetical protein
MTAYADSMGTYPAHDEHHRDLWARLRAQVQQDDPVPAAVVIDAYECLDRPQDGATATYPPDPSEPSTAAG